MKRFLLCISTLLLLTFLLEYVELGLLGKASEPTVAGALREILRTACEITSAPLGRATGQCILSLEEVEPTMCRSQI